MTTGTSIEDPSPLDVPTVEPVERPEQEGAELNLPDGTSDPEQQTVPGEAVPAPTQNCDPEHLEDLEDVLGWGPSAKPACAGYPQPQSGDWGTAQPFEPADEVAVESPTDPYAEPDQTTGSTTPNTPADSGQPGPSSSAPSLVPSEPGQNSTDDTPENDPELQGEEPDAAPGSATPTDRPSPSSTLPTPSDKSVPAASDVSPGQERPSALPDSTQELGLVAADPFGAPKTLARPAPFGAASRSLEQNLLPAAAVAAAGPTSDPDWGYLSPNWVRKVTAAPTPARLDYTGAWDAVRGQVVLFGGRYDTASDGTNQTWIFNGSAWQQRATPAALTGRILAAMAWSESLQKVVLFGGSTDATSGYKNDMWAWDGTTWALLPQSGTLPGARRGAAMVWDPIRQGLVLFGGAGPNGTSTQYFNDTYLYKNGVWTRLNVNGAANAPSQRERPGMAWSYSTGTNGSGEMVLYGGGQGGCPACQTYNDTWVMGSAGWVRKNVPAGAPAGYTPPPARYGGAMAYSSGLEAVVMHGGAQSTSATTYNYLDDTWAWDGEKWLKAEGIATPGKNLSGFMVGTSTGELILHSLSTATLTAQTWVYDTSMPGLKIDVLGASAGTSTAPVFQVGDTARVRITALNTGGQPISGLRLDSALQDTVLATGSQLRWFESSTSDTDAQGLAPVAPCPQPAGTECGGVGSLVATLAQASIPSHGSRTVEYVATMAGASRGCAIVDIPAVASSRLGGSAQVSKQATVCGGGLGSEDWWSYDVTNLGGGATAEVNSANGNMVLKQTDTPAVLGHGKLALTLGRVYNSQTISGPNSPLGFGWQFDLGQTGEGAGGLGQVPGRGVRNESFVGRVVRR